MSTPFEKLIERLDTETGQRFNLPLTLQRTRAGWRQVGSGAWAWVAEDATGRVVLGSFFRVKDLLRTKDALTLRDSFGVWEVVLK